MGETLDNPQSMRFNCQPNQTSSGAVAYPASTSITAGLVGGNGLVNNSPFPTSGTYFATTADAISGSATTASATLTISVANANIVPGLLIVGPNIPAGTIVTVVSTTTLTLSASVTVPASSPLLFGTYIGNSGDEATEGVQFTGAYNNGYYSRLKKYSDATNGTFQNLYGASSSTGANASTILTETLIQNEFKPYSKVVNGYIITYDVAVIRLGDVFDSMKNLPLMKKFDGILRMYINTGTVASVVQQGGYLLTSGTTSTFTNTCPLIQSCLPQIPATAIGLGSGLFISKATATNLLGGLNLASSNASHSMTSCRIYYPQITLKPEKLIPYISENRAKKVVYTDVLFNTFNAITSGSTYSALVQSGVTSPRGILIIPFISSSTYGTVNTGVATGTTTFSQIQSPFDQAPNTNGPISLTNLQVAIGGTNQLYQVLNYSYENFLEQVALYEKLNNIDIGLSCGLINEFYWNTAYRCYYVDVSRANVADLMTPRNVNVSFQNNSNVTIDVMVFTEYFSELTVDVETGIVTK